MKNKVNQSIFILFCSSFLFLLLFCSNECITLASNGLLIWYKNMIPSLFPFMVLSGFMVRSGLSLKVGQWLQPVLGLFFRLPSHMLYAIFMGFLCGFPMGAKIVADMLEKEQITLKEGEYLLAFCNNIGPLYLLGYVIPLFGYKNVWQVLGLMYLVPLGYGFILKFYYFHNHNGKPSLSFPSIPSKRNLNHSKKTINTNVELSICSHEITTSVNYLSCFQQALSSAIEQITLLGGCMVFFNCLLIFPQKLNSYFSTTSAFLSKTVFTDILCSLIEIGGGLKQLADSGSLLHSSVSIYLPLCLLTFGGMSCIIQTYFIIKNTGLKISTYIKHKVIQACIYIIMFILYGGG